MLKLYMLSTIKNGYIWTAYKKYTTAYVEKK